METMTSKRGKKLIIFENHKFYYCGAKTSKGFKWRCTIKSCISKLYLNASGTIILSKEVDHNHEESTNIVRPNVSHSVKRKAVDDLFEGPPKIVRRELKSSPSLTETLNASNLYDIKQRMYNASCAKSPYLSKSLSEVPSTSNELKLKTCKSKGNIHENNLLVEGPSNTLHFSPSMSSKKKKGVKSEANENAEEGISDAPGCTAIPSTSFVGQSSLSAVASTSSATPVAPRKPICILCGSEIQSKIAQSVVNYSDMILLLCGIDINLYRVPLVGCKTCIKDLENILKFKNKVLQSRTVFKEKCECMLSQENEEEEEEGEEETQQMQTGSTFIKMEFDEDSIKTEPEFVFVDDFEHHSFEVKPEYVSETNLPISYEDSSEADDVSDFERVNPESVAGTSTFPAPTTSKDHTNVGSSTSVFSEIFQSPIPNVRLKPDEMLIAATTSKDNSDIKVSDSGESSLPKRPRLERDKTGISPRQISKEIPEEVNR